METDLDTIADGKLVWYKILNDFYSGFEPTVKNAFEHMEKTGKETGELCPNCGNPLVIRNGKFGAFVACSNYPECKYIKKEEKEVKEFGKCPECEGTIVEKKTRKGKIFYGCNRFPKCKYATWEKPNVENS
jgi:DNA topoisomerase-1